MQVLGFTGLARSFYIELSNPNKIKNMDFNGAIRNIKRIHKKAYKKIQTETARKIAKKLYESERKYVEEIKV